MYVGTKNLTLDKIKGLRADKTRRQEVKVKKENKMPETTKTRKTGIKGRFNG